MNQAMGRVDEVAQRNASAAQDLSSTAGELRQRAEALRLGVSYFKVANGAMGAAGALGSRTGPRGA